MVVTPATVLASIESIPETPENFRTLRTAIRDLKTLINSTLAEQEK